MSNKKELKRMQATLPKKFAELQAKMKLVSQKAPILEGKDHMIELDPKNEQHREWYEED